MKNWSYRHNSERRNLLKGISGPTKERWAASQTGMQKELKRLRKEKYVAIYRHWNEYPVSVMRKFFQISRSERTDQIQNGSQIFLISTPRNLYLSMICDLYDIVV
ncbi:hypothetical protein CLOSTMETH_02972 [[Clostridium] methylpentosum DSM 5476]|uniref:Uncharacterized protein n=1 Tax=[Clostridium] methylpentosum DSM 5476 TaxID=537013 RepID=C0EGH9_9FIRM|nr:hypothetical protein CLOSTMETH_02972 [[Clostridium] methylpentosum DSM 5476]